MTSRPVLDRRCARPWHVSACGAVAFALCASVAPALTPAPNHGIVFQKQDPKPTPTPAADPLLEAERDKLRMKDVEAWKKLQVKSLDQVIDVKKTTQPLELPESITEAERTKMADLLQKAKDGGGGARTGRALRELEKMGYPALLFLINHLREIDYKDPTDAMFGMQVNMTLQNITLGVNTGYVTVEIGEPMDPRKAQWNAKTVQEWQSGVKSWWTTREKFDEFIKNRKAKRDAELEEDKKGEDPPKKKGDEKPPAGSGK